MFAAISFIFFTALVAVLSYFMTRDENLETQDGYFLGGRSLKGVVIGGSLMLTNLSTEQLVGMNGAGYRESMVYMTWEIIASFGLMFLALVLLPKYLKSGLTTIPEFLEERYDKSTRQMITILFMFAYVILYLPTILYSGSLVLTGLFHVPELLGVSQFTGLTITVWAIGIAGSIYAIFGGLKAVAVSDTLNGVGLLVGGLSIPFFALHKLGNGSMSAGLHRLITEHPEKLNSIGGADAAIPFSTIFTGAMFISLFYWTTNQAIVQRTFAAKNLAEGQKGVLFAGALKCLGPFFLVIPGIIAFHLYPNLENGDMAYPTLIGDVLPTALTGFMGAVLFGAILSSFNSILNSTVTMFCINIYRPSFNPGISDKDLVALGKKMGTIVAIISMLIAPFIMYAPAGLFNFLMETWGYFNMPIVAIVLVGFFTKRISAKGAKIATVFHLVFYGSYKFGGWPIHWLHILGLAFPLIILIMYVVSKFSPRETPYEQKYTGQVDLTEWKYGKHATLGILFVIVCLYVVFSKAGIAA